MGGGRAADPHLNPTDSNKLKGLVIWQTRLAIHVKTIEPWILHDYKADFYGKELRLAVAAYVRPEVRVGLTDLQDSPLIRVVVGFL